MEFFMPVYQDFEEVLYSLEEPEPKCYEAIPGLIDYLTYIEETVHDDGTVTFKRKRLKAAYKDVYRVMKKLAGEGVCIRDVEYIAQMAGIGKNSIADVKKVFLHPFEQLDGKSLIQMTEKQTMTQRPNENGEIVNINKKPVHVISVSSIWKYNNPFMKKVYALKAGDERRLPPPLSVDISNAEAEIAIEKMMQDSISKAVHNSGAYPENGMSLRAYPENGMSSPGGISRKRDGHKHPSTIPLVKEQYPPIAAGATPVQIAFLNKKMLSDCFDSESSTVDWLEGFGFKKRKISEMLSRWSVFEISLAVIYIRDAIKKRSIKKSATGYLLQALEEGWWAPNLS